MYTEILTFYKAHAMDKSHGTIGVIQGNAQAESVLEILMPGFSYHLTHTINILSVFYVYQYTQNNIRHVNSIDNC